MKGEFTCPSLSLLQRQGAAELPPSSAHIPQSYAAPVASIKNTRKAPISRQNSHAREQTSKELRDVPTKSVQNHTKGLFPKSRIAKQVGNKLQLCTGSQLSC